MHRLAGERQPEGEQVAAGGPAGQPHPDLAEVDLGVRARPVGLRDEHLGRVPACLAPNLGAGHPT